MRLPCRRASWNESSRHEQHPRASPYRDPNAANPNDSNASERETHGCWLLQAYADPSGDDPDRAEGGTRVTPSVAHDAAGAVTAAFPGHPHDGLAQSQKRYAVALPFIPGVTDEYVSNPGDWPPVHGWIASLSCNLLKGPIRISGAKQSEFFMLHLPVTRL